MLLGTILALATSYFGGWLDWVVGRLVDIWMAFPPVVLALILLVCLGAGVNKVVLAIILIDWTRFARVIRAEGDRRDEARLYRRGAPRRLYPCADHSKGTAAGPCFRCSSR